MTHTLRAKLKKLLKMFMQSVPFIASSKKLSTHAHLTLDDRIVIQEFLDQGTRLKDLARQIKKHPSSVTREIKRFRSRRLPLQKWLPQSQVLLRCDGCRHAQPRFAPGYTFRYRIHPTAVAGSGSAADAADSERFSNRRAYTSSRPLKSFLNNDSFCVRLLSLVIISC